MYTKSQRRLGVGSVLHDSNNSISNTTSTNPQDCVTFDWLLCSRVREEYNSSSFQPVTYKRRGLKLKLELQSNSDYSLCCYMTLKQINGCSEALPQTALKRYSKYSGWCYTPTSWVETLWENKLFFYHLNKRGNRYINVTTYICLNTIQSTETDQIK